MGWGSDEVSGCAGCSGAGGAASCFFDPFPFRFRDLLRDPPPATRRNQELRWGPCKSKFQRKLGLQRPKKAIIKWVNPILMTSRWGQWQSARSQNRS